MKKTIVCGTCLKIRNCCQSCLVDVYFKIPMEFRDAALKMAGIENPYLAEQSKNREVKAIMADKQELQGFKNEGQREKAKEILATLAEKLGKQKPAVVATQEQESASSKDLTQIVAKLPFGATLTSSDEELKSFFVFGFDPQMPQYVVKDYCEKMAGPVSTKIAHRARCGFVTFETKSDADKFAKKLESVKISKSSKTAALVILEKKYPVRFCWGAPKPLGGSGAEQGKIGAVVVKVMKQLAEKDASEGKRKRKTVSEEPRKAPKKTYNAEREIEL